MSDPNPPKGPYAFFNFPEPLETHHKYVAPPKGANPVVRGAVLAIGAPLVEKVGFVSKYLYNNAGFDKLRTLKALEDAEHRFDPTVIPLRTEADDKAPVYTDEASLRKVSYAGDTKYYSVADYYEAYKTGKTTPRKVIDVLLPLIRRDIKDRSEHATSFLETKVDLVIAAADASTQRWATGTPLGVLDGVPVGIKDELDVKSYGKTFGSSKVFETSSKETSWCVAKWEEAGAIIVGKTNMHEIGMDTTNNNPTTGTPRNPFNRDYYTGGSSGGSGYAVGAGLVPIALGCGTFKCLLH
jgi:hypothetical protein